MSGLVFLALLSCFQMVTAVPCDYRPDLIEPYLSNKTELYCFDDDDDDVVHSASDVGARLCDTGVFTARSDGMDVRCGTGYIQVGYRFYDCNTDNGELGGDILNAGLTPYSDCVADADAATVCTGVNAPNGQSLSVDNSFEVENIDLVNVADDETVQYLLVCDDGFDFHSDVTKPVIGFCSGNTDGNVEYTLSAGDGCYELCDAGNTNMEGVTLNHDGGSRSGEKIDAEVDCPLGFDIAHNSPALWEFTCGGILDGVANGGQYSCGDTCPECLPQCPVGTFEFDEIADGSIVVTAPAASGLTVSATVECDDGFGLAVGAEQTYEVLCNTNENTTAAGSGFWTVVNDLPACLPKCSTDNIAAISFVDTVVMTGDAGVEGSTNEGVVTCDSGYALGEDAPSTYSFTCTGGEYVADGDGPVCLKECNLPAQDFEMLAFTYEGAPLEENGAVGPGRHVVDVSCVNETLSLVGPRSMSCKNGDLTFDGPADPFCSETIICEPPNVINGELDTMSNLEIGGVFTIECDISHYFDAKTVKEMNPGSASTAEYSITTVECKGEPIRDFECYFGCLAPDFDGATIPDMAEEGQAPFEMGAVVNFQCLDGQEIKEGGAKATCEVGGIGAPVCGTCTFTISLLLLVFSLLSLL